MTSLRWRLFARIAIGALAILLAYPCARCAYNLSYATLGRDTGIYQFVAWAILHGQKPYVDIRENNGPLVYIEHLIAFAFGGGNEHVFRTFDIVLQCGSYFVAGWVASGPWSRDSRVSLGRRVLFASTAMLVLFSQYIVFDWWSTAQRESTYDALLLVGLSAQLAAHQRISALAALDRRATILFGIAGAIVASTTFGKPTYVVCSLAQPVAVLVDPHVRAHARRAVVALSAGACATVIGFLVFVAIIGDIGSYVRIVVIEAPKYYVPIWRQKFFASYSLANNAPRVNVGLAAFAILAILLALRQVPASLVLVMIPVTFGLASFFAQRKGFLYHLHPVTCGAYWIVVVLLGVFSDRVRTAKKSLVPIVAVSALVVVLGWQCTGNAVYSDYFKPRWMPGGLEPSTRETRAFYDAFWSLDFDGQSVRETARYVAAQTKPDATVQMYGLEPYVLFLAQRRTATPFIFLYDLNMDPALEGGPGGKPDADAAADIRRLQARNAKSLYDGIVASAPGAFVLIDHAPMAYAPDALVDFRTHCPEAARWMEAHYVERARFHTFRVFLPMEEGK